jgi:hypothetical protein
MRKSESRLPFNYKTIRVTQSRIDKGLLAIPVSLIDYFPKKNTRVHVTLGIHAAPDLKSFTPGTSSSGECRIGGMRGFYERFGLKDGDEVVMQFLDSESYRILTEKQFEDLVKQVEEEFDESENENVASAKLGAISKITNTKPEETLWSEFYRLATTGFKARGRKTVRPMEAKETTSPSIRKLLTEIYCGKCQVTGFWFLMKNGRPYFEIHHIKPEQGDHVKNVLVVSPNAHAQFTHAVVEEFFDNDGWLRRVKFNDTAFAVNHVIDKISRKFQKEVHF